MLDQEGFQSVQEQVPPRKPPVQIPGVMQRIIRDEMMAHKSNRYEIR